MPVDIIAIDNEGGTRTAVNHLIETGHTTIGTIMSSIKNANFIERHNTFLNTLEKNGLTPKEKHFFPVRPTQTGSYEDMLKILEKNPAFPRALFAENDIIASGAIRAMKEKGITLPEEVSIVGFDDLAFCEIIDPPLTTIRVFKRRLTQLAVQRLIERINGHVPEFIRVRVGTDLVVRKSVLPR